MYMSMEKLAGNQGQEHLPEIVPVTPTPEISRNTPISIINQVIRNIKEKDQNENSKKRKRDKEIDTPPTLH